MKPHQALGDDLRRFLDGRTDPGAADQRRGTSLALVPPQSLWSPRMTGIAAAALFILAVGATIAAFAFRARAIRSARPIARRTRTCWNALTAQARATRFSRQVGQRFESLDALEQAAAIARELGLPPERFDPLRDQAIACLALPDMKATGRVIEQPADTFSCLASIPA